MIYESRPLEASLSQGDIFEPCALVYWVVQSDKGGILQVQTGSSNERVIVLTQACDLANSKTSKVQVAVVHDAEKLVRAGVLKAQTIRDQVRRHQVFGWYFLPAGETHPESIVDLHDIHTIPREILERDIQKGHRVCGMSTPYREHLLQHFATTYSRIALPEPYETLPE
ncbi:MAG TPA: hypothetical protein VHB77_02530 [Planctomycetaceae bacterium]|nr:hypothetical protein [Planctomycetaceae bacterium]